MLVMSCVFLVLVLAYALGALYHVLPDGCLTCAAALFCCIWLLCALLDCLQTWLGGARDAAQVCRHDRLSCHDDPSCSRRRACGQQLLMSDCVCGKIVCVRRCLVTAWCLCCT